MLQVAPDYSEIDLSTEEVIERCPDIKFIGPGLYIFKDGTYAIIVTEPRTVQTGWPYLWRKKWPADTRWSLYVYQEQFESSLFANPPTTKQDDRPY